MSEPTTEAGRALLRSLHAQAPVLVPLEQDARAICAIEAEARTLDADRVAEAIYDAMRVCDPEGRERPWVPGGNSLKQDEARRRARAALDRP